MELSYSSVKLFGWAYSVELFDSTVQLFDSLLLTYFEQMLNKTELNSVLNGMFAAEPARQRVDNSMLDVRSFYMSKSWL